MTARYELRPVGVHDTITGEDITPMSGAAWAAYHEWLAVPGNELGQMSPPPEISFEEAMARKLSEIEERAARQRRLVTGPMSAQETAGWAVKREEAIAFEATPLDASAPMLAAEAKARGVTTAELAARVLRNSIDFAKAEAVISGTVGRHRDALRLLKTAEEVLAYDLNEGWL